MRGTFAYENYLVNSSIAIYQFDNNLNDTVGTNNFTENGSSFGYTTGPFDKALQIVNGDYAINVTSTNWGWLHFLIRTDSYISSGVILGDNSAGSNAILYYQNGAGQIHYYDGTNDFNVAQIPTDGIFHQLDFVHNGTQIDISLDGQLLQGIATNIPFPIKAISRSNTGANSTIENLTLSSSTVSTTTISQIWNNGTPKRVVATNTNTQPTFNFIFPKNGSTTPDFANWVINGTGSSNTSGTLIITNGLTGQYATQIDSCKLTNGLGTCYNGVVGAYIIPKTVANGSVATSSYTSNIYWQYSEEDGTIKSDLQESVTWILNPHATPTNVTGTIQSAGFFNYFSIPETTSTPSIIENVARFLFVPSPDVAQNFVNTISDFQNVVPFSLFIQPITLLQNAVSSTTNTSSSININFQLGGGRTYNTALMANNILPNTLSASTLTWWYNTILMITVVLFLYGLFKLIF